MMAGTLRGRSQHPLQITSSTIEEDEELLQQTPCANVHMHRYLLYLQPRGAEEDYFGQLEALDLVNCLIAPVFFANALSLWTRTVLSSIYCICLLLKGYQMGLLLLPNARRAQAHKRARYWVILGERVMRQWLATPLLGRGPHFKAWLVQQAADSSKLLFSFRLLLLLSGFTISFWNAFCLPLDFVSNTLVTMVFFVIHFPATCAQVAYPVQLLLERVPHLLLIQQGVESTFQLAAQRMRAVVLLQLTGASKANPETGGVIPLYHTSQDGKRMQITFLTWKVWFERPNRAPDVESLAGRFILTCSITYMVFIVLLLPLYISWRLERHLKSKWMASVAASTDVQQQQQMLLDSYAAATGRPSAASPAQGARGGSNNTVDAIQADGAGSTTQDCASGNSRGWHTLWMSSKVDVFVHPPVVFDMLPPTVVLLRHVAVMFSISAVSGNVGVAACRLFPGLVRLLWQQVIYE